MGLTAFNRGRRKKAEGNKKAKKRKPQKKKDK